MSTDYDIPAKQDHTKENDEGMCLSELSNGFIFSILIKDKCYF